MLQERWNTHYLPRWNSVSERCDSCWLCGLPSQ